MYFYILRCKDNSLYCGIAVDLEKRVKEHNAKNQKGAKYTRAKGPVYLIYSEKYPDKKSALRREREVKRWTKNKKEKLVKTGNRVVDFGYITC